MTAVVSTIFGKASAIYGRARLLMWCQVRREFFVALIPCAFSHFLCSARALVSAAVLGRLAGLRFGVDILITRDICWLLPIRWQSLSKSGADVALAGNPNHVPHAVTCYSCDALRIGTHWCVGF
jgi:hypothetical protein